MCTRAPAERIEIDLRAREKRVYDRLRAKLVTVEPGERAGVRDLLLFLPDLVVLLLRLVQDPRVPMGAKAVAVFGVGYALSPIDLLPEILFGPIGFIDDLLVVAAAISRIDQPRAPRSGARALARPRATCSTCCSA